MLKVFSKSLLFKFLFTKKILEQISTKTVDHKVSQDPDPNDLKSRIRDNGHW
jgi:hypothetical protein